jgi:DNA-directed RNA polymerase subunit RPC12/RpoP
MIQFSCSACRHNLEVGERLANTHVNCPECGWRLLVPPPPPPPPPVNSTHAEPTVNTAAAYRKGYRKGLLVGSVVTLTIVAALAGAGVLIYLFV